MCKLPWQCRAIVGLFEKPNASSRAASRIEPLIVEPVFIFDHKYFLVNPGVTASRGGGGLVNPGLAQA